MHADEQAIRTLVAKWHNSTAAGDAESVLQLMAEDVVFLVAGQPPMKGRSVFEKGLRGLLASHRIVSTGEVQEVQVSGNLAYCWAILNVEIANCWWEQSCPLWKLRVHTSQASQWLLVGRTRRKSSSACEVTPNLSIEGMYKR